MTQENKDKSGAVVVDTNVGSAFGSKPASSEGVTPKAPATDTTYDNWKPSDEVGDASYTPI